MKVSRQQAQANHEAIVAAAGALFRERGFEGVGLAEIMQQAGLTHGGFYGHFASKDELAAAAAEQAIASKRTAWARLLEGTVRRPLARFAELYLSKKHVADAANGCAFAALAGEAARQPPAVRAVFAQGMRDYVAMLEPIMPARTAKARRREAIAMLCGLVGALTLARAVDDPVLADEVLATAIAGFTPS
ncbi:MAG: TetR/AcrR family transcriptional regulator [Vulcanimicrobiaceae bacterium]|jgi:TetR/AcrR family transcriptional repressor of nem operon